MVMDITDKFLGDFSDMLLEKNISLTVSNEAKEVLNYFGFDADMGARSVMRAINNEFKRKISKEILFGKLDNGGVVKIGVEDGGFTYLYGKPDKENSLLNYEQGISLFEPEMDEEYDFETAEEAWAYAKANVGTVITRASSGYGYIIKKRS